MPDVVVVALITGFTLDLLLGDPPWLPHPVRMLGRLAEWAEPHARSRISNEYAAGAVFAVGTVAIAGGGVAVVLWGLQQLHEVFAGVAMAYFMFTGLAMRDLAQEARAVWRALQEQDLERARARLSRIVGRDTERLETAEVVRGTVETVAESTVDGVLAPLFFATLGGAPLLWAYKAMNTLDSMVGHHEAPYTRFGWVAARMDDIANVVPARVALLFFAAGTLITGGQPWRCLRIGVRDGRKHPSPNAGISEAAMAGALGVRLGGKNTYDGVEDLRPYVGDPVRPLEPACIPQAIRIMYATSALALAACLGARWWVS
ncbi:MAG: cobalamin biosynthesis protein CobD [Nitrospinae bacterium]|nr:cobalamin biosynthesis protein CobD [Nitrospinota bacterium]